MKLDHRTNCFQTHQPVIIAALNHVMKGKPVLELGSGMGSTPLLHVICEAQGRNLFTIDHDEEWLSKYREDLGAGFHRYRRLEFEEMLTDPELISQEWGLVFCDQGNWQSRTDTMIFYRDKADFLILHDSDPYRDSLYKEFKYGRELMPLEPMPAISGPPTFIASNRYPVDFEIDMSVEEWNP